MPQPYEDAIKLEETNTFMEDTKILHLNLIKTFTNNFISGGRILI